jgi:hypothetical protein
MTKNNTENAAADGMTISKEELKGLEEKYRELKRLIGAKKRKHLRRNRAGRGAPKTACS